MPGNSRKRILILGGGFAGLDTALSLERIFSKDKNVDITLVNQNNYFVYTPMLAEVVGSSIDAKHAVCPIREFFNKVSFKELDVKSIDLRNRVVNCFHCSICNINLNLEYDYLAIALGSITSFHNTPGADEYSFPLKNVNDAKVLRSHVIDMFEHAELETDPDKRRRFLTFVVAGGGYTGVEVAAELNDFIHKSRRFYRNVRPDEVKVIIVDHGSRIMHEMSESLASYGEKLLRQRGMEIYLKTGVTNVTLDRVEFDSGKIIPTMTLIWAAGTAPHPVVESLPCAKDKGGRIVVNEYLEVSDWPNVWAIGDCAHIPNQETGNPYPPTAQHAVREGRRLAYNIEAAIYGKEKKPFQYVTEGMLAPLGHRSAVAEIKGFKFSGFFAWFLWRSIYLAKLPGLDRKLRVALDWALDLFFPRDIVQLKIVRRVTKTPDSH
jgi:NADH dehydrogenase